MAQYRFIVLASCLLLFATVVTADSKLYVMYRPSSPTSADTTIFSINPTDGSDPRLAYQLPKLSTTGSFAIGKGITDKALFYTNSTTTFTSPQTTTVTVNTVDGSNHKVLYTKTASTPSGQYSVLTLSGLVLNAQYLYFVEGVQNSGVWAPLSIFSLSLFDLGTTVQGTIPSGFESGAQVSLAINFETKQAYTAGCGAAFSTYCSGRGVVVYSKLKDPLYDSMVTETSYVVSGLVTAGEYVYFSESNYQNLTLFALPAGNPAQPVMVANYPQRFGSQSTTGVNQLVMDPTSNTMFLANTTHIHSIVVNGEKLVSSKVVYESQETNGYISSLFYYAG